MVSKQSGDDFSNVVPFPGVQLPRVEDDRSDLP